MIRPDQSGPALLEDIQTTHPAPGEVAIWWLGQSGYADSREDALKVLPRKRTLRS